MGRRGTCGCTRQQTPRHLHLALVIDPGSIGASTWPAELFGGIIDTMRADARNILDREGMVPAWWVTWHVDIPEGTLLEPAVLRLHVPCRPSGHELAILRPRPAYTWP